MDRDKPIRESQPVNQVQPNWLDELVPTGVEMAKTAGLFLRGGVGIGVTLSSYAFGEMLTSCKDKKLEDLDGQQMFVDALRGTAKGGLMKASFVGLGRLKTGVATQGVLLGESSRFVEACLSKSTYENNSQGVKPNYLFKTGISQPVDRILNATFDPLAMASDAVVFVAGHGMFKGLQKVNPALSERPIVATSLCGGTFGMASGSAGELFRQKQNNEDLDLGKVVGLGLKHAAIDAIASLPAGIQADAKASADLAKLGRQAAREMRWRYWQDIAKIKPRELGLLIPAEITKSKEWLSGMEAINTLKEAGYEAFFVGGCVRDLLLNKIPKDYDVVTNAPPHRVNELFPEGKYAGKNFAVKHANINDIEVEIATFRSDGAYSDGRRPDEVTALDRLPTSIAMREDAGRRDLTINSMYLDPNSRTIYYYFDGPADLMNGVIDSVGNPRARFDEDPSRILRVAVFAGKLGFEPSERVVYAMIRDAHKIHRAANRTWGIELGKLLMSEQPVKGLTLLKETGLIKQMIPELERLDSPEGDQDPIHHPEGNTWNHTMMAVEYAAKSTKRNLHLMFSTLFHDIGKPDTQVIKLDGRITNYGHDVRGAEIIRRVGRRIDLPNDFVDLVAGTGEKHMVMHNGPKLSNRTRHNLLMLPYIEDLIELQHADALGRGKCCASEEADAHEQGNAGSRKEFWDAALAEARNPVDPIRKIDADPILGGEQLLKLGYKSGVPLGEIKEAAAFAQFEGEFSDMEGALLWLHENCETPEAANKRAVEIVHAQREKKRLKREAEKRERKNRKKEG